MQSKGHILSVSELTHAVQTTLETRFPFVWVQGQVVNVARPGSGHLYFTLRDANASINAVWFKGNQAPGESFDPLTGEVYQDGPKASLSVSLENGQEILCAGRLAVYPPRGTYQIIVELAQEAGQGKLYAEFIQLRNELAQRGYFDPARKRPLPPNPRRIALITAANGAAVHDFLRVAKDRGLGSTIRVYPAPVQGEHAPARLEQAIAKANTDAWAQVIVLIRGGGALEDLHAFNTETVARAVFTSSLPVLAGIGHEIDVTLADMTADVRAATPSHAAQLLWVDRQELSSRLNNLMQALAKGRQRYFAGWEAQLGTLSKGLQWASPSRKVAEWETRHQYLHERLARAAESALMRKTTKLRELTPALSRPPASLYGKDALATALAMKLYQAGERKIAVAEQFLEQSLLRLAAANPLGPLERGYALVRGHEGSFIRSRTQVRQGDALTVTVQDGEIIVQVR